MPALLESETIHAMNRQRPEGIEREGVAEEGMCPLEVVGTDEVRAITHD